MISEATKLQATDAQAGIWYAHELDEQKTAYNTGEYVEIKGRINVSLLIESIKSTVLEADSLHGTFYEEDGKIYQGLHKPMEVPVQYIDVSLMDSPKQTAMGLMQDDLSLHIDLKSGPIYKEILFKVASDEYLWYQKIHHIACDAFGFSLITNKVASTYSAQLKEGSVPQTAFKSLSLLVEEEKNYKESTSYLEDRKYWNEKYKGVTQEVSLSQHAEEHAETATPIKVAKKLTAIEFQEIKNQAKEWKVAWPHLVIAAMGVYHYKMTGERENLLTLPMMNRSRAAMNIPATTMNILPLLLSFSTDTTFEELIKEVVHETRENSKHQHYRQEQLQRDLGTIGQSSFLNSFQVNIMPFAYQPIFGDIAATTYKLATGPIDLMNVNLFEQDRDGSIRVDIEANGGKFTELEVENHANRIIQWLRNLRNLDVKQPIWQNSLLLEEERALMMRDQGNPTTENVHPLQQFKAVAKKYPNHPALEFSGEVWTYKQLDERTNVLASKLLENKRNLPYIVGVAVSRSANMIVSILSVWKAGGAYVPIDIDYPEGRLNYMLSDSQTQLILTDQEGEGKLPSSFQAYCLNIEEVNDEAVEEGKLPQVSVADPAYMIYTSGSTGNPKGVLVPANSLAYFLSAMNRHLQLSHADRFYALTTISFDISILEMVLPITVGGTCVIAKNAVISDPPIIVQEIKEKQITTIQATPTHWQMILPFVEDELQHIKVLVGGEKLPAHTAKQLQASCKEVHHVYGPTETTIWSTHNELTAHDGFSAPPLGSALVGTVIYILDEHLQLVAPGRPGEIYIAGEAVTYGYYCQPALTASRFVANPYSKNGGRMYRTGDIGIRDDSGILHYLKRSDDQVKVRGHRMELGEIEHHLLSHKSIKACKVIVREDQPGDQRITAYLMADGERELNDEALDAYLSTYLPDYMIPSFFMYLDAFPLTLNGKLNMRELPIPLNSRVSTNQLENLTPIQQEVYLIFQQTLLINDIEETDSFFALGGHSLLASQLLGKLRQKFGLNVSFSAFYQNPTIQYIVEQVKEQANHQVDQQKLKPYKRDQYAPMSNEQKRLWFIEQTENVASTYYIPVVMNIKGPLSEKALYESLVEVMKKQEALRTVIETKDGAVYQRVLPVHEATLKYEEKAINRSDLNLEIEEAIKMPIDWENELGWHNYLFKISEEEAVLCIVFHHLFADGWSIAPFMKDLSIAYQANLKGEEIHLTPLPIQYGDYSYWQQESLVDEMEEKVEFWKNELAHLPEAIPLPYGVERPEKRNVEGGRLTFEMNNKLYQQMNQLAKDEDVTLFMVLQSALATLYHRLGAGEDIPFGTPVAGRNEPSLQDIVGFFVNTMVLRTDVSGDPSFLQLLQRVKQQNMQVYDQQDAPFDKVVEAINPTRSNKVHPLFQSMIIMQNTPQPTFYADEIDAEIEINGTNTAKFDLTFEFWQGSNGLEGAIEYRKDLYHDKQIEQLLQQWLTLLRSIVTTPNQAIGKLPILIEEEKQELLQLQPKKVTVTQDHIVHKFEQMVAQYQDEMAVTYEEQSLTYQQLNEKANKLARLLLEKGVRGDDFITISLPRSVELIISILAVLKTGAAYVPIDPDYPEDRKQYIHRDAKAVMMITDQKLADHNNQIVINHQLQDKLLQYSGTNLEEHERNEIRPDSPAYIIYTSGSTGNPKGVLIPHRNVIRLFASTNHWFSFDHDDVWTLFHSYAFDFSVWEIWGALLFGGKLVIVPYKVTRNPQSFLQLLVKERVTVLNQTPSAFYQLMEAEKERIDLSDMLMLRYVIFGGEALELPRLESWYQLHANSKTKLINMYGITETTVHVSYFELTKENILQSASSLIGEAIPDLGVYILDDHLQPVPKGVIGEMYVCGDGLAHGYLNQPALTAERFVANPYGDEGSRMYKTGDLAKWTEEGSLDYIGRSDHQVKIRGFRIELGEINAALLQYPSIKQAVTTVQTIHEDKQLVSYVISDKEIDYKALRQFLQTTLPKYMIPNHFVKTDDIPLTNHGKLDMKALPKPEMESIQGERHLPRTPQEEMLTQLFAETLHLSEVSIDDSFFDLGGHSLLAVQLMKKIEATFGKELGIGVLFEAPTATQLAKVIEGDSEEGGSLQSLLGLRKTGNETPLFCVHPAGGLSWCYAGLMSKLDRRFPIYGLQAKGIKEKKNKPTSLVAMARDYIEEIRSVQPKGPYRLLGWSLGGNVIHAMAVELQKQGEDIEFLVMMDSYPGHFISMNQEEAEDDALIAMLALGGYDPLEVKGDKLTIHSVKELLQEKGSVLASLDEETIENLKDTYQNSVQIMSEYEPEVYEGDMIFFKSTIVPDWFTNDDPARWLPYVHGRMRQYDIACRHKDMCQPEPLAEIGEGIAQELENLIKNKCLEGSLQT